MERRANGMLLQMPGSNGTPDQRERMANQENFGRFKRECHAFLGRSWRGLALLHPVQIRTVPRVRDRIHRHVPTLSLVIQHLVSIHVREIGNHRPRHRAILRGERQPPANVLVLDGGLVLQRRTSQLRPKVHLGTQTQRFLSTVPERNGKGFLLLDVPRDLSLVKDAVLETNKDRVTLPVPPSTDLVQTTPAIWSPTSAQKGGGVRLPVVLELVIVRQLLPRLNVTQGKYPHPHLSGGRIMPLLGLAVRLAAAVDQTCDVALVPCINGCAGVDLHEVEVPLSTCFGLPQAVFALFLIDDLAHVLDHEAAFADWLFGDHAPSAVFRQEGSKLGRLAHVKRTVGAGASTRTGLWITRHECPPIHAILPARGSTVGGRRAVADLNLLARQPSRCHGMSPDGFPYRCVLGEPGV
mmetsp:Transcript_8423/g.52654  ORF Transcript_8423/g.52654 Transcript_8423/m.52654 type:complete len:410 (-) Transcript_8423:1241-2470(-)